MSNYIKYSIDIIIQDVVDGIQTMHTETVEFDLLSAAAMAFDQIFTTHPKGIQAKLCGMTVNYVELDERIKSD